MSRTQHIIALCLALLLGAGPTLAQTGQPAPAEPAAAESDAAKPRTPASQPSAGNTKQNSAASGNARKQSDSGGGSPYDYRASEEISEDLPVSFPADI